MATDDLEKKPVPPTTLDAAPVIKHARIELPEADYERLRRNAKHFHLSISAYIRQAVIERIEHDEKR